MDAARSGHGHCGAGRKLVSALGDESRAILASNHGEPWRQFVELLVARLPIEIALFQTSQLREGERYYRFASELAADLETLYDGLCAIGAHRLAESDVRPVRRALEVFGFTWRNSISARTASSTRRPFAI